MINEIQCNLGIDVSVLINNVGMSYEMPATFLEMEGGTDEATSNLVKCNITSLNNMTAIVLPQVRICTGRSATTGTTQFSQGMTNLV